MDLWPIQLVFLCLHFFIYKMTVSTQNVVQDAVYKDSQYTVSTP